ncbi:hypothetical protein, partial [Petrachloros mirabilis]
RGSAMTREFPRALEYERASEVMTPPCSTIYGKSLAMAPLWMARTGSPLRWLLPVRRLSPG